MGQRRAVEGLGVTRPGESLGVTRPGEGPGVTQPTPTRRPDPAFWAGRRVLLTGHTGFKGSWAALWLAKLGAQVTGLALAPEGPESHYTLARVGEVLDSHLVDLTDAPAVARVVAEARPQTVLHLAAQALVRRSLADPARTFASNVMGTAHLLDAIRAHAPGAQTLVVTSDKVYANAETGVAFAESAPLGGKDPYSASKAACEIVVASYRASYGLALATARGGNVIGGGDFAADRIVPDLLRAARAGGPVRLRHPWATRPWQHVLDCLTGYLLHAERLGVAPALNFGPMPGTPISVAELAEAVGRRLGLAQSWVHDPVPGSVEAQSLALDSSAARAALGWSDALPGAAAIAATADWYAAYLGGADPVALARDALP